MKEVDNILMNWNKEKDQINDPDEVKTRQGRYCRTSIIRTVGSVIGEHQVNDCNASTILIQ